MKQGKTLVELAQEIERQSKNREDMIADTRAIAMDGHGDLRIVDSGKTLAVTDHAHRQIGDRVGIPAKYYDRMRKEAPGLLATNVNNWFAQNPEKRLIRTLDGYARAFLSDRYQRIDNNHVAEVVLPVLSQTPGIEIMSAEITESRLYIKAVTHSVSGEIKSKRVGDFVEAGVLISNSEVGLGAVQVMPFFHFLVCTNGMVRNKEGLRAAHLGTKLDGDDYVASILTDETRKHLDQGVLLKVRDTITAAMDPDRFAEAVRKMQGLTTQYVSGDPAKAIEVLADDFGMIGDERSSVLRHLIEGGDLSRYGVMNAVTRTAADLESYDRATEFEAMGGRILDLPAANWERYAKAA